MRTFKHSKLGRNAVYDSDDDKYIIYKTDEAKETQYGTYIDKQLIEGSNDREEVIEKDWIDKVVVELAWDEEYTYSIRKAINKHMPRISEQDLEDIKESHSHQFIIDLLRTKGLLAE